MENLKLTEIFSLNKEMARKNLGKPYKVNVLSNVTVNSFKDILEYFFRINNIEPEIEIGNYDNILQDSIAISKKDIVIVMYEMLNISDAVDTYFEDLSEQVYQDLLHKITSEIEMIFENLKQVPSVIFNTFSTAFFVTDYLQNSRADAFVKELNSFIQNKKPSNFTLINIDKVIAKSGIKLSFDRRFYLSSKAPYSITFFKNYCTAILAVLLKNTGNLKKAIIFDCDNTLWKGILGEDGFEGIDMSATSKAGRDFNIVQQMAKFLSTRGVIVGICSKNNLQDVNEVLLNHKDIVLKDEYIVIKKINWDDKVTNLKSIAKELNIGTDSLVFVDDSNFEVNLIREQLPEILTLQVPLTDYADFLQAHIYSYFNTSITADDSSKTAMYKQQFEREEAKNLSSSLEDYLASLKMEISIETDNKSNISRIAQISQKTNQFNLTTKRYTENQIQEFFDEKNTDVITLSAKDKFGDNGLTGICIIHRNGLDGKIAIIDSLLMSCRIIGRNIETAFLNHIILYLKSAGSISIEATFISTAKNVQVKTFYDKMGFRVQQESDIEKKYLLNIAEYVEQSIPYIVINEEKLV